MPGENDDSRVEYRWGHSEGITAIDVPANGNTKEFVTCGADSDLRIWKGFEDDDPVAHELTDNSLTLMCGKNGDVFVGTEFNTVEALSLEDGKNLGVKGKFTAPVNHLDLSPDGKWLVAGAGDMKIQLIDLEDSSNVPVVIDTHIAPVLSVALDPLKEYLVSSGCDGHVYIWSLTPEGKHAMVKDFENMFPSSNDIINSSTLCRMSWEKSGRLLALPEENHVALYTRETWMKLKVLKPQKSKSMIASVTKFSNCGKFLAAGGSDGTIIVWDIEDFAVLVEYAKFPELITSIAFGNSGSDIIAADKKGRILLLKDFKASEQSTTSPPPVPRELSKVGNDDGNSMDSDVGSPSSPNNLDTNAFDDDDDDLFANVAEDENEFSISKIKADTGFIDDQYVGVNKATKVIIGGELNDKHNVDSDDDSKSVSSDDDGSIRPIKSKFKPHHAPAPPQIIIPFTKPQNPFQPASSPVSIEHRFLVWNNTGIIRGYTHDDDENQAIDIEFHDAAVHHAIHLRNPDEYKLATLTKEVAVFANKKQSDQGSKLFCYCFASWDSKKEWSTELPIGEEVVGIAAGNEWIAASTDQNRIRLFTTGGAQKQIIEVGGQIIVTSGHEDLLFVSYHNGIGMNDNQCISYSIFRIRPSLKPFPLIPSEPLPLSPKSQISWIGFSDEGTPVYSDSMNVLRILNGRYWTPFCSMRDHLHNKTSDYFWVVGVSELDQKIRAVKCKGMKYPPTLPRPVLMQLEAKVPFCEMETEKSRLEDKFHRSFMLDALSKKMNKKNYEVDEYKAKAEKEIKESLFNLFVLSCNGDWNARGTEYVSMMPSAHAVQVAVKYASKLRKKGLVDRLTAVGRRKLDEEDLEDEGDDDDFETMKIGTVIYSHVQNRTLDNTAVSQDLFSDSVYSPSMSFSTANRSVTLPDDENPFMKKNTQEIRKLLGSSDSSGSNRFRKSNPQTSSESLEGGKGLSVIDSWKKPTEKPSDVFTKVVVRNMKGKKATAEKEKTKEQGNKDKKKQATLLDMGNRKSNSNSTVSPGPASPAEIVDLPDEVSNSMADNQEKENSNGIDESTTENKGESPVVTGQPQQPAKKGYIVWFAENKEALEEEFPDKDSRELTKIAMQRFKQLSSETKKSFLEPTNGCVQNEEKKRKRSETEDMEHEPSLTNGNELASNEKKSKFTSALSAFVRQQ